MATAPIIRSDEQIQNDVLFELKWDPRIHPNEVGVAVKGGIVTLMGSVDSYTKHWAAEEAARRVRSVKAVVNEIEVKLPVTEERSDEDIAAAAIQALEWDAVLRKRKRRSAPPGPRGGSQPWTTKSPFLRRFSRRTPWSSKDKPQHTTGE